jgi:hypothetical protein
MRIHQKLLLLACCWACVIACNKKEDCGCNSPDVKTLEQDGRLQYDTLQKQLVIFVGEPGGMGAYYLCSPPDSLYQLAGDDNGTGKPVHFSGAVKTNCPPGQPSINTVAWLRLTAIQFR